MLWATREVCLQMNKVRSREVRWLAQSHAICSTWTDCSGTSSSSLHRLFKMGTSPLLEHFSLPTDLCRITSLQPHAIIIHISDTHIFSLHICYLLKDCLALGRQILGNYVKIDFLLKSWFKCFEKSCSFYVLGVESNAFYKISVNVIRRSLKLGLCVPSYLKLDKD